MLLNSLVLPNGIWQMQLFQINQSEDSSKITIMYNNPSGQLHQRSITSAFNYNRTYSIFFGIFSIAPAFCCIVIDYLLNLKIKVAMHNSIFTVVLSSSNFIYKRLLSSDAIFTKHQLTIMTWRTLLVVFMIAAFQ